MSISVPDPTISATISINPIPAARAKDVDTAGRNFLFSLACSWMLDTSSLSPTPLYLASTACCSATKDVVTLSSGTLNSLDTRLKTDMDTPTAASSTEPICPTKAVSTSAVMGSAASASTAGTAMPRMSIPTSSSLNHPSSQLPAPVDSSSFSSGFKASREVSSSSSSTTPLTAGFPRHCAGRHR